MTFKEMADGASQSLIAWVVVAIAGGLMWLVRRVFTNQKQIEMLQADLSAREELRQRDRADFKEVKSDVKEMRREISQLFLNHGGEK